jgi:hypothetical protein
MIDRKTEESIKFLKTFVESWRKFHQLYLELAAKNIVTKEDEGVFSDTRELMAKRYSALKESLEFTYMPYNRLTDPVTDILDMNCVFYMSEERSRKIEEHWVDSYIFLNKILERLENRKRRLEHFSAVGVWMKRVLENIRR